MVGLVGAAAGLLANQVSAQPKPSPASAPRATPAAKPPGDKSGHGGHAEHTVTPAAPVPPGLQAIVESTAACLREGRVCLAHCTEYLAAGHRMEQCQRAVMNMLAVTAAMADVAGYRNADPKNIKALATSCAAFCRACAAACEPHKDHHAECKACFEACVTCAKACESLPA
jgi:Cys-rich four helix bundle protein (predicted Tat secretion target)